ncbi:MAG: phosphohistidine-like domain-containing protein, partial [bacterium]
NTYIGDYYKSVNFYIDAISNYNRLGMPEKARYAHLGLGHDFLKIYNVGMGQNLAPVPILLRGGIIMNEETSSASAIKNEHIMKQLIRTGSLVDHYGICHSILNSPIIDTHILAWVFVYIRLFSIKDIKQDMRNNYQTKDISHIQNELSMALTKVYMDTLSYNDISDTSMARVLIRNIFNFTPRGGGNGDELRLFILDTMRRHGIREGHRPGIDDPFLEEWHQKLHSCCTPEDIGICEAYILFQETNSHDLFYKNLWERNGISVDYLKNMPRPLGHAPRYMPQLIPDLKHLLWILKQIHGGSDNFHYLLEVSKWQLDKELYSMLEDVRDHFGTWWIPGKIVDCRQRLRRLLQGHCPRDPLMIDVALDNIYKTSIEKFDLRSLSGDDIIALILLTLQNIHLSCDNEKTDSCIHLWDRIKNSPEKDKWSREWGLQAFAALTYIQSMIHSYMDELYEYIEPKARLLGESCGVPESYLTNFTEEVIRSQNTFVLSKLVDALFPMLRKTAHIGPWKIISHGEGSANGAVRKIESLLSIQGCQSERPHIIISQKIDGIEDIPNWVTAIITASNVDILSHIAIRCRNAKVILCTCYEQDEFEKLALYEGKTLTVEIENDRIRYHEDNLNKIKTIINEKKRARNNNGCSKSGNLMKIGKIASDIIKTPFSAMLPFEAFEKTLRNNRAACNLFEKLTLELASRHQDYSSILSEIRTLINNLTLPPEIIQDIREQIISREGMASQWTESLEKAVISNIKKVWGSAWNERAYLSRFSRNLNNNSIRMGVLMQNVIPADYSFIIHTRNPLSNNDSEMLSEIAVGLGESLTGNSTGTPLCIVSDKKERTHRIISYPSKQSAYFDSHLDDSYIMRSDSNDEDLSDFTGAGLYDSYLTNEPVHAFVKYDKEKLFWDKKFQYFLFDSLIKISEEIEGIMKCPQDIEGVYAQNSFYIVQTRNLPRNA